MSRPSRQEPSANPLLGGLQDALPLEPSLELPRLLPTPLGERENGYLAPPYEEHAARSAPTPARSAWRRLGYLLAYLLVLVVALSGYFVRSGESVPPSSDLVRFTTFLQSLPGGTPVLVAVEYGLAGAGEIDPLLSRVLDHLALRSAGLLTVSTQPQGIGVAERMTTGYPAPVESLGLLPGEAAGARLSALHGPPVGALLIVTDNPHAFQVWVEQAVGRLGVPAAAVLSLGLRPQARAYEQSGQLRAVVAGLGAAAQYESLLGRPGVGRRGLDSLLALSGLLIGAILAGNVAELLHRRRPKHES